MEFQFYIKDKDSYKLIELTPPSGANWQYFKGIKLTVEEELNNIRKDILNVLGQTKEDANLIFPRIDDDIKQEKIDILVSIREKNTKVKNELIGLLQEEEFIVCENCNNKMFKTPLGISYERLGNSFLLKNMDNNKSISYIYLCEHCFLACSEEAYNEKEKWKKLRQQLIDKGETWVPNDFGFYYGVNKNRESLPSIRRTFETYKLKDNNVVVKIIEKEESI